MGASPCCMVILDFDGTLIDSYEMIRITFARHGLDVGERENFTHRKKFLKYLGSGKTFPKNLLRVSFRVRLRTIRETLTEVFRTQGRLYGGMAEMIATLQGAGVAVGILSRNFTFEPKTTVEQVLQNSGVDPATLAFIETIPVGAKKSAPLTALTRPYRAKGCKLLSVGDERGDLKAARAAGIDVLVCSYGFDSTHRLVVKGGVEEEELVKTPEELPEAVLGFCGVED